MKKFLSPIALALGALILASATNASFADDWQAVKLRGDVEMFHDNVWERLNRGDIVSDTRVIRTLHDGSVEFARGGETIDLAPDTQIQIFDRADVRFTGVREYFGQVTVKANVENIQHFSVQTRFIAAIVKGTIFSVASSATDTTVSVKRGKVGVDDI